MITILFLPCLSLLDFRQTPIPDSFDKRFIVTELAEQSTTGCGTSPSQGRAANTMIEVEWINHDDPHDVFHTGSTRPSHSLDTASPTTPKVMPYDPPGLPDPPEPGTPPVAAVREPPTAAILTVS